MDYREEWSDPGHMLELNRMGFADGLAVCVKRLKDESTFWEEEQEEEVVETKNSVLDIFS